MNLWTKSLSLIFVSGVVGCSDGNKEQKSSIGKGAGDVCFSADDARKLLLVFDDCASYCAEIDEVFCEALLEGDTIRVWGDSSYFVDQQDGCDAACKEISATCTLNEDLTRGTYTVDHHGVQTVVELPADTCVNL